MPFQVPKGTFLIVSIVHRLKIDIFHFPKAVIKILLCAAAPILADNMGAFSDGLAVWDAVRIFCYLHENHPFVFF